MRTKIAVSIAGSDSSGGAGIQADLKSFSYLGVHGATVITCVTAQNTQRVTDIFKVSVQMIEQQLDAIFDDCSVAAVKTGMLYDEEIVNCVAKRLSKYQMKPVVDPVMVATSGDPLSHQTFVTALEKRLLPSTLMVTANVPEACILAQMKITSTKDVQNACKKIFSFGPEYVLLKGGHLKDDMVIDTLYDGKRFYEFSLPRIHNRKAHGSGCTLSALITGLLTTGESPVDAVKKAKSMLWGMIYEGYLPGKGSDVLNHSSAILSPPVELTSEQFAIWLELRNALKTLLSIIPSSLIPEVGMNFAYATTNAKTRDDICAIDGRIVRQKGKPRVCGSLEFGASKHVASIVLAAMSFDAAMRCALNIRYSKETVALCKRIGLTIGSFDRKDEPTSTTSTMEWGTKQAIITLDVMPDVIYDLGGVGKEPMIRILGKNPKDVLDKIQKLVTNTHSIR